MFMVQIGKEHMSHLDHGYKHQIDRYYPVHPLLSITCRWIDEAPYSMANSSASWSSLIFGMASLRKGYAGDQLGERGRPGMRYKEEALSRESQQETVQPLTDKKKNINKNEWKK